MTDVLTRLRSTENDVVCPCLDLRTAAAEEITQLRSTLSLAEEGLANYAQEVEHLRAYQQQMNDILKENERLRAERLEVNKALELPRDTESNAERVKAALRLRTRLLAILNHSLEWALACQHDCPACDAMYDLIRQGWFTEPQSGQQT